MLDQQRVERLLGVPELRLVVAVVHDPLLEHLGRRLLADRPARHLLGRGVEEEEQEQEQQDADQRHEAVGDAANDVGQHHCLSRRKVTTPGATTASDSAASAHAGQRTGRFHSARRSLRSAGSTST